MTKHLKNIVKGMSSILEIAPEPRTHRHIPRDRDDGRLQGDLRRVGKDMYKAIDETTHGKRTRNAS